MKRCFFLHQTVAALPALALPSLSIAAGESLVPPISLSGRPFDDRTYWLTTLLRVADPLLTAASAGRLKTNMPVETAPGQQAGRRNVTHLEALGRTLTGLAPWLELAGVPAAEAARQQHAGEQARQAIAHAVNPADADFLNLPKVASRW